MDTQTKPVAVVTGGRQGLGRGCARALAERGFDLVIVDLHHDDTARETVASLEKSGARAAFLQGDIARIEGHADLAQAAWNAFGRIDCLVNNAGVTRDNLLARISEDQLARETAHGRLNDTKAFIRWLWETEALEKLLRILAHPNSRAPE